MHQIYINYHILLIHTLGRWPPIFFTEIKAMSYYVLLFSCIVNHLLSFTGISNSGCFPSALKHIQDSHILSACALDPLQIQLLNCFSPFLWQVLEQMLCTSYLTTYISPQPSTVWLLKVFSERTRIFFHNFYIFLWEQRQTLKDSNWRVTSPTFWLEFIEMN